MPDLTDRALDTASAQGATYADVRVVRRLEESIAIKTRPGRRRRLGRERGLRRPRPRRRRVGLRRVARPDRRRGRPGRRARPSGSPAPAPPPCATGRASTIGRRPTGTYETPLEQDPFTVPLETKIADLLAADEAAARVKGIAFTESSYAAQREWKTFAATDGSLTEQVITHVGAAVEANAIDGDEHQRRSYPDSGGGWQAAGYEYIQGLGLAEHAEPLADEAVALLTAPQCPSGRFTIVLDPSQLYLQVHESCGHPTELDRVFGTEASYAGTSFLTTDKLDEGFRYGSDLIDIVADATAPGGMGTFGWDDEGVAAQAVPLVKNGHLRRLPVEPRDGAAHRPPERWRDARRRLEPHPAHPDDQHQPAAEARDEPRRDRRRHGRRPVPRVEPVLVDRRPPPQLPVRDRGRLRDQGRQEGPAVQEPDLHRASPTSSGARATRSATSGAT